MAERPTVSVRVRRVSGELRELRRDHGLAADEVARALGMSVSKLSRVENGIRKPVPDDVSALLGLYRVPAPRREELLSLVRDGEDYNWSRYQNGNGRGTRTGSCLRCGTSCPSSSRKPR